MNVVWNGSNLDDEDHPNGKTFDSSFSTQIYWNVPSFAPNGHYDVHITGTNKEGKNALCIYAFMDL